MENNLFSYLLDKVKQEKKEARRDRSLSFSWFVIAAILLTLTPMGIVLGSRAQSSQESADQGQQLASKVQLACSNPQQLAALQALGACQQANQIKSTPAPGVPGTNGSNGSNGTNGSNGVNGRGIVSSTVDPNTGDLILTYTDRTTQDVGHVLGQKGDVGLTGRSITGESLTNGDLVLSFSDGTTKDVGNVVGKAGTNGADGVNGIPGTNGANGADGCSISSTNLDSSGNLSITYGSQAACGQYKDTTVALGNLRGPAGTNGSPAQSMTMNFADGSSTTCTRSGGPDTAPVYNCPVPTGASAPTPTTTTDTPILGTG